MSPRSRPIAQRARTVTARIAQLKEQLSGRTRDAFKSDYHYRTWYEKTNALLSELEDELSILNEPGEYDQLPPAVVAEELGTTTDKVRLLIKGGEILATGKPAHEYVSREELAAACEVGVTQLLRSQEEEAPHIFEESVEYLRQGQMDLAERACRRLVARESIVGAFALPYETAFLLARGEVDEVEARLGFIRSAEDGVRARFTGNLRSALRGVRLQNEAANAIAERLLHADEAPTSDGSNVLGSQTDELQQLAMFITMVIFNEIERRCKKCLQPGGKDKLRETIQSAVYSSLHAQKSYDRLSPSKEFVNTIRALIPRYYQPARLIGKLVRDHENDEGNIPTK